MYKNLPYKKIKTSRETTIIQKESQLQTKVETIDLRQLWMRFIKYISKRVVVIK